MSGNQPVALTKKDFATDQLVRWCPGCGDYSILSQVQATFAELGIPQEQFAIVAGIGCSSRFPYYMSTYGFHTIHGRAPAFATGLKATRPDLSVWVITGDGDALSIGGNHIAHVCRRNVDLNVLLFNNRIYGLTKGQYSPTSEVGKRTKSSPMGSIDAPFEPLTFALGSGAAFVARTADVFTKHLRATLAAAEAHRGTSFIEIYQNCNIFNDGAFANVTGRGVRDEDVLYLTHGEPMVWGKERSRGLVLDGLSLKVVELGDGVSESDCLVHDTRSLPAAQLLARIARADGFPTPMGVIYDSPRDTYDAQFNAQLNASRTQLGDGQLDKLLLGGESWSL